jgi:spore germination protein KC
MEKRTIIILILLLSILLVSGCWDAIELEDRDICTAVVVEKNGDQYEFYVEVAGISAKIQNPRSGQEDSQQPTTSIVKGSGKTYAEARINLDKELNKPVYLGAVQSLILTERLADNGIDEYTLRLRQMTEYRKTMDVIVTPDKPEDFLSVQPANESAIGFAIEDTLENLRFLGISFHMTLSDLLQKLSSKNPCYMMNTMSVRDEQITLIGHTLFDGGKRVGFIPFEESRGIVFLTVIGESEPKFDYVVNLEDKTFTLETTQKKRSIKSSYDGEKASFEVNLNYRAVGRYPSQRVTITDQTREELKGKLTEQIQNDIQSTIDKSQKEYECDYLSFSEPFRIAYPDAYEAMNWHDEFKKAEFHLNITVDVVPNRTVDYDPNPIVS